MTNNYESTAKEITAVDGVEVDITVRGDEDRAEKVMMDLKERMGVLAAAFDHETPPEELPDDLNELGNGYVPFMTVAWERVFEGDGDDD